ncbi:paraquat-inducible protein A [Nitratifractor salsuginis]|uniref:Paraquat-inducible protein A n=1 Tax=Nitratifractor salsuginis (strain DSM 16511 / JCM 12458 / E9I37-1) TaxID=749222 RepID=E6X3B2_NITSE|nr:paraquat-inducible protein A [Nitratifractor salsuginis]ADV47325.1 Paraquat-inducible protein A [Nitratifractor salsuginis DSM 16511]
MKWQTILGLIWTAALVVTMAWLGKEGYRAAIAYEQASAESAKMMEAEQVAQSRLKDLASTLTFGMVKNDLREKLQRLEAQQEQARQKARRIVLWFAGTALSALVSAFFLPIRLATGLLSVAALIALINGLITPILMVTVHKNVEYLGDVVLSFESKGILGSVAKLFHEGNWPIAGVILLFSVLLPALKTLSLLFVSLYETRPFAAKMVRFFKHLGKWSMLDVFVVALLLVFLTSRGTDVSRAEAEIGIYFFLAYVILSLAASLAAEKMLEGVRSEE